MGSDRWGQTRLILQPLALSQVSKLPLVFQRQQHYLNFGVGVQNDVLVDQWVRHYNTTRPHSSLGYKPPAPEAIINMPMQNLHSVMH